MSNLICKNELQNSSVSGFINFATHDYISARILLLNGQAGPGTVLAVTALEKLMKSYCLENNICVRRDGKGHNLEILISQIDQHNNNYLNSGERKFLRHISKAYIIRYPTELKPNFETFLPSMKILANLDQFFCRMIESNPLHPINKGSKWYDMFKIGAMKKVQLIRCNVHFGTPRVQLIEQSQWYVAYYQKNSGTMELYRKTDMVKDDDDWSLPIELKK